MPKSPILRREIFFDYLGDGTMFILHWALVDTELGGMIESRMPVIASLGTNPVTNIDMIDCSFNKLSPFDANRFSQTFGTSGYQFPVDVSNYETAPIKHRAH